MTLSDYCHLKQQIKNGVGSSERHAYLLTTLKDLFRDDINSPRRLEKITTISQLLNVLELRDTLSEDDVSPLKKIAEKLPNKNEVLGNISQYEASHVQREYRNYYTSEPIHTEPVAQIITSSNPYGQMSPKKKDRIMRTIVEEIGNSWRDLARNLKISEGVINRIEHNNRTLTSKAGRALEVYLDQKADPDRWFFELCEALEKSRRKDLSKSVTKILTLNI